MMENKSNIKTVILNFLKNMFSYAFPVAILQFIVQPLIAAKLGADKNGLFLTMIAVVYFVTSITSAILLQVRLLRDADYKKDAQEGDFNIILLMFSLVVLITMLITTRYYSQSASIWEYLLTVIVGLMYLIQNYLCVYYRIHLQFTKILISNICMCVGYVLGIVAFYFVCDLWQIVFVFAYASCLIYDICNTKVLRERYAVTPLFKETFKKYLILAGSSLLGHLVTYGDRIILYPLTNGSMVSILTSAEIMGKMLMLIASPLSGFLLSYIVREKQLNFRFSKKMIGGLLGFLLLAYVGCCLVSIPMLKLLYPDWADQALYYVPLTTLTSLLNLIAAVSNVVIIRFAKSKWQLLVNGGYLAVYLSASFVLLHFYGLIGFCIGNLIASLLKNIIIFLVAKLGIKFESERAAS